ncbi:MAG: hypothetical protein KJ858_00340 [Nanoarchaeota archaeon]|nr:hypothetical protein [Nanoarchaeota archaeon]
MEEYILGFFAGTSITFPYLVWQIGNSVKVGLKAREALELIRLGESPRNYRHAMSEVRSEGPIAELFLRKRERKFLEDQPGMR